jgi:amino acid adenylation domain-containing protein
MIIAGKVSNKGKWRAERLALARYSPEPYFLDRNRPGQEEERLVPTHFTPPPSFSRRESPDSRESQRKTINQAPSEDLATWPTPRCLHHLFEEQVRRTPEAVAVVCKDKRWTYRELDHQANRLAHQLRSIGVGPQALVGLCVERSLEMVAGILGILKVGAAYVPLDPGYPAERLAVMLEEARLPLLVTQLHLRDRLPAHRVQVIFLGGNEPAPDRAADETGPIQAGHPDDLAYVIFTSGSTGRPKGVMVRHRNVAALFEATQFWYQFHSGDVWTLYHSFAFDFSVWELWGALLYGGRLVVVPHATSRSPRAFYDLLLREQVTVLNQTPSAFRQLMQVEESFDSLAAAPSPSEGLALRLVIFGGEALTLPALKPWLDRHGDQCPRLVNMYGITETTVHVTYRPIHRADLDHPAGSMIGRPVPGWQVYLLNGNRRPVAEGEVGEIHVGGKGVAAGYLHRPELTEERFVPDPFSLDPGARLYRSGDLARRLPDGDLVYLGRSDDQVKVRGFRIELLEIESVLARHPNVREAAVLAREDAPGERRTVAYVSARHQPAPTAGELRSFLQAKVPEYMIPAGFVFLEQLPLTDHGKVNRAQLPVPVADRPAFQQPYLNPQDDCQRRLQEIWERLLHVRPVGVRDNFFELGGDSLLLMNLSMAIKKSFGWDVSPALLLEWPTIQQLAENLHKPSWSAVVPLQTTGTQPPFFCVHPLGGQVLGYRLLARFLGPDQPFYGLQGLPIDCPSEPWTSLEEGASTYLADMLRVQPEGPYYLGGYSLGAFIAFEMAQQLHRQGREVAFLGMLDDGPSLVHDTFRWTMEEVKRFLSNVPRWLVHQTLRKKPKIFLKDLGRKLRVWFRRVCHPAPGQADVEEALDVSRYSEGYRQRLAISYGSLKKYVPRTYPGRITVFRARTQSLLGSHCPDLGWGRRALRGVEVYVIPGDHNSIMVEPDVRGVAAALSRALSRSQVDR